MKSPCDALNFSERNASLSLPFWEILLGNVVWGAGKGGEQEGGEGGGGQGHAPADRAIHRGRGVGQVRPLHKCQMKENGTLAAGGILMF